MPWSHPAARMRETDPGHPGHLGQLGGRQPARLPGRVLPAHADDPDVRPGPQPVRQPADLPGRGGRADDRGGRRGGRRAPGPRLHHRAVPARGDAPGPRAGPGRQRPRRGRRADLLPGHDGDRRPTRPGWRPPPGRSRTQLAFYGSTPAYRPVLELHGWGDLQHRAQHPVQAGPVGGDGRPHRRRDGRDLRRRRPARRVAGQGARPASTAWSTGSASTRPTSWSRTGGPTCWPGSEAEVGRGRARPGRRPSDDDVDQPGRPGDDPLRRRPGQRLDHRGEASGQCARPRPRRCPGPPRSGHGPCR